MSLTGLLFGLVVTSGAFLLGESAKENREKQRKDNKFPSKTNIPLQKQVAEQMSFVLSKDLNVIKPEVTNLYDYICNLRTKHGLPPNDYLGKPIWTEGQSKACALSEKNQVVKFLGYGGVWLKEEPIDDFIKENIRKKYTIEERIAGVPYYDSFYSRYPAYKNDKQKRTLHCTLQTEMNLWYHNLWQEIMLREMRTRGYALSYDGIHGTPEEEAEKKKIEDYKNAVKYPWTVTSDYLKTAKRELIRKGIDINTLKPPKPPVDEGREEEINRIHKMLSIREKANYSRRFNENGRYEEDIRFKSDAKRNRIFGRVLLFCIITLVLSIILACLGQTVVSIILLTLSICAFMGLFLYVNFLSDTYYIKPILRAMQKDYYEYPSNIRSDLGKEYALLLERLKTTKKK